MNGNGSPPENGRAGRILRAAWVPIVVFLFLLAAWHLLARYGPSWGWWRIGLFPTPLEVWDKLVHLSRTGELGDSLVATMRRLLVGFGISLGLGVLLALVMTRFARFRRAIKPYLLGIQSLPGIAWVPFAILWFGFNEDSLIFVTVIGSVFAVTIAFADALALVPVHTLWAARTMGSKGVHLIVRVGLPAALPNLVSGAKQCWAFAWRSLIGAEMVFASSSAIGLGHLLGTGREFLDPAQVMAIMLCTLAVGALVEVLLFSSAEKRLKRRWGLQAG